MRSCLVGERRLASSRRGFCHLPRSGTENHMGRIVLSVSRHTQETDAGNLALRIEAQQKAGRIAARKDNLHHVECLLPDRVGFQNLGMRWRRSVFVLLEVPRRCLHHVIRQLSTVVGGQLRTIDLTRSHLAEPFKRKGFHAGRQWGAGEGNRDATCQPAAAQGSPNGEPHLRRSLPVLESNPLKCARPYFGFIIRYHDLSVRGGGRMIVYAPLVMWLEQ